MFKKCLFLFFIGLTFVRNIEGDEKVGGASPEEETDTDIINEYLKGDEPTEGDSSSVTTKNGLTPATPPSTCNCVKYYQCHSQATTLPNNHQSIETTTLGPSSDPSSSSGGGVALPSGVTSGDILGIVDIRQNLDGQNTSANGCPHYFDVCCSEAKNETTPTGPTLTDPEEPKSPIKNLTSWVHQDCGHRNENGIGFKITGGTKGEAQYGEFPWTVAIVQEQPVEVEGQSVKRSVFLCGGALLHPQLVLTAAHCVFQIANSAQKKELKVRVGEWDTQTVDEPYAHEDRYVKEVIIHPELYRKGLFNDIALLLLEKQVKLAPNADTICLPSLATSAEEFNGQSCFSSGWGKDDFGAAGRYQEIMKKVQVPIVPRKTCESQLRKTRLGDGFRLHDSFICAGGEPNIDTCIGDGGSPLVCKSLNSPNYVQLGMVAWGIGCGNSVPGVYVNVPKFTPWILQNMNQRNLNTKLCTLDI